MKRFLFGLAALPFLAGVAFAAENVALSDTQMDGVTAGFGLLELPPLPPIIFGLAITDPGTPSKPSHHHGGKPIKLAPPTFPGLPNIIVGATNAGTITHIVTHFMAPLTPSATP